MSLLRRAVLAAALLTAGGALVAVPVVPADAAAVNRGSLDFNSPPAGQTVTSLIVGGSYSRYLTARVLTANGGRAVSVLGNFGYGNAIDLPAYGPASASPPLAIVSLRNNTATVDPLNPGYANFTWRADFSIDDNLGTEPLDGDNLVQRGLSPQKQWKLSVDAHRARCTVRTVAYGPVTETPPLVIPRQTTNVRWYRAVCNRSLTGVLTLRVWGYWIDRRAWVGLGTRVASGSASGSLGMDRTIPVSVGGKLTNAGFIQRYPSTDQFNGKVDNVVLTVG